MELVRLEGKAAESRHRDDPGSCRLSASRQSFAHHLPQPRTEADRNSSKAAGDAINIVVLQADGRQFGLVVDEINDTEEIVVKPLGKQLKGISCFAGATIMGDGKVALILDILGLAQRASLAGASRANAATPPKTIAAEDAEPTRVLVALPGRRPRKACRPALDGVAAGGV